MSASLKHHLEIEDDDRASFLIESFGFSAGGKYSFSAKFKAVGIEAGSKPLYGLLVKKSQREITTFLTEFQEMYCLLTEPKILEDGDHVFLFNGTIEGDTMIATPQGNFTVASFKNEQYNVQLTSEGKTKNYLSSGQSQLPTLYTVFVFLYFAAVGVWIWWTYVSDRMNKTLSFDQKKRVYIIHHLMTALFAFKLISLFFHSFSIFQLSKSGEAGGWEVIYNIVSFIDAIMLFVVIALIGSGWSFVKPFLSENEKKLVLIIIPLQVIDNIAYIIVEETAPGSEWWEGWMTLFRLIDFICCGAILFPIVWSVGSFQRATESGDTRMTRNLLKLQLFRFFYFLVVVYIYFTRIIVYIIQAFLSYDWFWMSDFLSELATLSFFVATGYLFKPATNNPYLQVPEPEKDEIPLEDLRQSPADSSTPSPP